MPSPSIWSSFNTTASLDARTATSHKSPPPVIHHDPTANRISSTSSPGSNSSQEGYLVSPSSTASSSSHPRQRSGTSSLNSSPPSQGEYWSGNSLSTIHGSQDLLRTQRNLYQQYTTQRKPLAAPPHLHRSFSDWQNSLHRRDNYEASVTSLGRTSDRHHSLTDTSLTPPAVVAALAQHPSMHTTTSASIADRTSFATSDLTAAQPYGHQHPYQQRREDDQIMRSPDRIRGTKSRRASSGGSRIPEGLSRDAVESSSAPEGEVRLADEAPAAPRWPVPAGRSPTVSSNVASPSTMASSSSSLIGSSSVGASSTTAPQRSQPHLDLANYPPQQLLKVLAALLHQIASANDHLRSSNGLDDRERQKSSRRAGHLDEAEQGGTAKTSAASTPGLENGRHSVTTAAMGALGTPSSTLCFHARNIPSISIESYLLRILKYCPTTNDVFLSLLVYFDRMSRMGVGAAPGSSSDSPAGASAGLPRPAAAGFEGRQGDSGDISRMESREANQEGERLRNEEDAHPGMRGFVIDSFNVHRLVIAGITVASKFFSDIFYTNSRYAKVGGLPVHELNQLELQFLLLNDFHLVIPLDELQRYADQLLVYGGEGSTVASVRTGDLATASAGKEKNSRGGEEKQEGKNRGAGAEGEAALGAEMSASGSAATGRRGSGTGTSLAHG